MIEPVCASIEGRPAELRAALMSGGPVVVTGPGVHPDAAMVTAMVDCTRQPGVGSASPIPLASASTLSSYPTHPASPPPPSLAIPCPALSVFGADGLASLVTIPDRHSSARDLFVRTAERLTQHGWRHVGSPGTALAWDPAAHSGTTPAAGWSAATISSLVGPANVGLEAHTSWAGACLGDLRVVVDGACISATPNTGTQHLVIEITRWLARTRPRAKVMLAVRPDFAGEAKRQLGDAPVEVVARGVDIEADVVYRPYQMLYAGELDVAFGVGRRALVGQLDMIGFSNPFYHPTPNLLFFARNLQRHMMRSLDGVTFISQFGRDSAVAECPDLEDRRLHVVSCGADPSPQPGALGAQRPFHPDDEFLVCLSSTFWHKNRAHAIATFARFVDDHGYRGHLVIGGAEPFYGQSIEAEDALLATLAPDVRVRVHRWGHITDDEKWWLLRHAQAALYPSVVEGFGLVPFEAAAVGTPCLAFAGTAPGELLEGTDGLIDTWDAGEWAARLARLVADPTLARRIVDAILDASRRHTWAGSAELTWNAIDHTLALPAQRRRFDDGGKLARISPERGAQNRAASLRFNLARGVPAIMRRVRRARMRIRF